MRYSILQQYKIGVDNLHVIRQIGSGTCGTVYAMKHVETGFIIAVKVQYQLCVQWKFNLMHKSKKQNDN